jgi:ferric-dicitrate binding protein FerR (iron transport regulator)
MSDQERIEQLLRLADPGPEIPTGGEARIRAAIRPLWRRQVRRRTARRLLWSAAFAAAAAAALLLILIIPHGAEPSTSSAPVARVELIRGPVDATLRRTSVLAGSRLHTSPTSRAALRVGEGVSLRLDNDTTVRLVSAHIVELRHGAVYVDTGDLRTASIEVRTPLGIVRDIGTRFEVRVESRLVVRVREGGVHVATGGRRIRVNAGFETKIEPDGSQKMGPMALDRVSWTAAIAPPFAIEGRSVATLLDWCSRESGLAVRYRNADAERAARTTLLHGAAIDLGPIEAAEVILPTAGLEAVREKGELVVRARSHLR